MYFLERPSTRLHAPPGGKSSFSLSHEEHVQSAPSKQKATNSSLSSMMQQPVDQQQQRVKGSYQNTSQNIFPTTDKAEASTVAAPASNILSTSEDKEQIPPVTGRRRQAPGGTSTIVLG
jgi:hypothetical protein